MTSTKERGILLRRILICGIGMFFYASGVALTKNCNLEELETVK